MVVVIAVRLGRTPSKLMMPLAFAAHAGSMLALTGTPVNVITSEAADEAGYGHFGFFEFTIVGVPLVVGAIAIVVVLGHRLLPERTPDAIPPDLSELARMLAAQYDVDHSMAPAAGRRGVVRSSDAPRHRRSTAAGSPACSAPAQAALVPRSRPCRERRRARGVGRRRTPSVALCAELALVGPRPPPSISPTTASCSTATSASPNWWCRRDPSSSAQRVFPGMRVQRQPGGGARGATPRRGSSRRRR